MKLRFLLIFLVIVLISVAGYFLLINWQKLPVQQAQEIDGTSPSKVTNDWKTYRNKEWGFEFEHPKDWTFEVNSFYSPFSKFNLQGNSSADNYNPLLPTLLLNIVTPEFANNAIISRRNREGIIESDIVVGGIIGKKFEYSTEYSEKISIDTPFGESRMILATNLATNKKSEDIFNQILTSFKFLNNSQ